MRAQGAIALGYMVDDGAPVRRDNLVVIAQKTAYFLFRLI
jgi:hypothetical protein